MELTGFSFDQGYTVLGSFMVMIHGTKLTEDKLYIYINFL